MPKPKNEYRSIGTCPKCLTPNADFSKEQYYCRSCVKRVKAKARYGLSPEEYDIAMGRDECDLCQRNFDDHGLRKVIDHDHSIPLQMSYRGTLCVDCNSGIGLLQDDRNLLSRASSYVDHNRYNNQSGEQKVKGWMN